MIFLYVGAEYVVYSVLIRVTPRPAKCSNIQCDADIQPTGYNLICMLYPIFVSDFRIP